MANRGGASSSSAPFTKSWKYDVFLSFRGEDTRYNFTAHLCTALRREGINTFMDDDELRRGEEISNALLTAIEDSQIYVVVFSENYASSKWCLDELVKILDCKESNQQWVIPVFYKVNPSDVRNHRGSFGDALANMDCNNVEKINRWKEALSQAGKLAGFTLSDEHQSEAKFIQNIIEEISKHVLNLVCLEVAKHPVGMQPQVQVMNELLDLGENDVRMVGIWGTGGIGKTTIAKAVYNSIFRKFEGCSFLANVRERSMSHEGSVGLQENLLSDILRVKNLKVTNVDKGAVVIWERLSCRKVLLVLDDVNDMDQLQNLAGACEWFGAGSRIIITTRDKQLLTAHEVNLIHEVKILDNHKALVLFCWHAFKTSGPPLDYVKLAERAIRYAQGLPLALEVLGCCLCGRSTDEWESALNGFKSTRIQDVLKISYDALDDERVKEVFLDIACFFKGRNRKRVTEILAACDLEPGYGIEVLIEKALISVEGNHIQMHDLLEEMGKHIVYLQSPTEAGGRSRLWSYEDIEHVLDSNTGTNEITRIVLNFPNRLDEMHFMTDFPNSDREICLNADSFSKMKNLKIFIIYKACISGEVHYLPNSLRVLDLCGYPFQSFPPNLLPKQLVVLNMPRSRIKQLVEGLKYLTKLTSLNFEGSQFLIKIPDLSSSPTLRYLNAKDCTSLVEVHPSVGYLDKLEVLDFSHCRELTRFPNKVGLKSLKYFILYGCKKLESFPEIVDKMKSLDELSLGLTAIKELPASIGHLIGLRELNLFGSAIKELPASIRHLIGLRKLNLYGSAIKELPASIGHLIGLRELNLYGSAIKELPASIGHLIGLEQLDLSKSGIKELPSSIGNLITLKLLWLCGTTIEELPSSIGNLTMLEVLNLERCDNLANLPQSMHRLRNLRDIDLSLCPKLVTLPNNLFSIFEVRSKSHHLKVQTKSHRLEVRTKSYSSLKKFCCWSDDTEIILNYNSPYGRVSKIFNLQQLDLRGGKRLVEILVQLPASIKLVHLGSHTSLEILNSVPRGSRQSVKGWLWPTY